ncbi:hypothetical protein AUJ26_00725 [Candidatus Falkowbacteria bacterium CG1_02_37_21]|nr:MAG: hypothetical protein AUJ26_00725 [Candidatus Falkowbacteria bacterium CG1_02_37_21]
MKKYILTFLVLSTILFFGGLVLAAKGDAVTTCENGKDSKTGDLCIQNPLGSIDSPQALIGKVINNALGVVGSIALLMFVYGGLVWMTSAGSPEKVKNGRDILVWSAIGMAVIFSAYGLTRFVLTAIAQ